MSSSKAAFQATAAEASTRARELALKRHKAGVERLLQLRSTPNASVSLPAGLPVQLQAQRGGGSGGGGARSLQGMAGVSSPETQVLGRVARARG